MKKYFEGKALEDAKLYALKEYPKEACGFILKDGTFEPCNNTAENPEEDFKIHVLKYMHHKDDIDAVIHSHNNYPHASKHDMEQQIATELPWGIINISNNKVQDVFFWGDSLPIQDLIGRPFYHGVYDCYSTVRDFYRMNGILLTEYPRDWMHWHKDLYMIEHNYKDAGFYEIDRSELRTGDVILGRVAATKGINHTGVYLGNNLILHHMAGRHPNYKAGLSKRDLMNRWDRHITNYMRYKDAENYTFIWKS